MIVRRQPATMPPPPPPPTDSALSSGRAQSAAAQHKLLQRGVSRTDRFAISTIIINCWIRSMSAHNCHRRFQVRLDCDKLGSGGGGWRSRPKWIKSPGRSSRSVSVRSRVGGRGRGSAGPSSLCLPLTNYVRFGKRRPPKLSALFVARLSPAAVPSRFLVVLPCIFLLRCVIKRPIARLCTNHTRNNRLLSSIVCN